MPFSRGSLVGNIRRVSYGKIGYRTQRTVPLLEQSSSHCGTSRDEPARPGPLEVEAADAPVDIADLADEVQTGADVRVPWLEPDDIGRRPCGDTDGYRARPDYLPTINRTEHTSWPARRSD